MMMSRTETAQGLLEAETRHTLIFAGVTGLFTACSFILLCLYGLVTQMPLDVFQTLASLDIVGGGFIAGGILITGLRRGRGHVSGVRQAMLDVLNAELDYKEAEAAYKFALTPLPQLPALPAPTLPAESDVIRVTSASGGVEAVPRETIRKFDPRDLQFLCRQLARGFKWTEAAMEKLELPYSKEVMGKASEGTGYTRFMELCTEAGIIVGREGKKSGTLAVLDAGEMMRLIKALPE